MCNPGQVSTLEQVLLSPDFAQSTPSQACTAGCLYLISQQKEWDWTLFCKAHKGLVSLEGTLRTLRGDFSAPGDVYVIYRACVS